MRLTSQVDISKKYAKAFYHSAGEKKKSNRSLSDMKSIRDLFNPSVEDDSQMKKTLAQLQKFYNPSFADDKALLRITKALWSKRLDSYTLTFIDYLAHKRRLTLLPWVAKEFCRYDDQKNGIAELIIISKKALTSRMISSIKSKLEIFFQKQFIVIEKLDDNILGGVRFQVGDVVYDATFRNALSRLEEKLLKTST